MSLAQKLSETRTSVGGTAPSLPGVGAAPRPNVRTSAKRGKLMRRAITLAALGWACVMGVSILLVHTNTKVLAETSRITEARGELSRLEQENRELQTRMLQSVSMESVEKWALAKGMERPATIKNLKPDPAAVAVREEAPVEAAPAPEPSRMAGVWQQIKSYFGRMTAFAGNQ